MKYIILIVGLLIPFIFSITNFLPNFFWFKSFNFESIYLKTLSYQLIIFCSSFVFTYLLFLINNFILNKILLKTSLIHDQFDNSSPLVSKIKLIINTFFSQFQESSKRLSSLAKHIIFVALAFFISMAVSNQWDAILLFFNAQSFSITDPIFNKDISFFIFNYPVFLQLIGLLKFIFFIIIAFSLWNYLKRGYVSHLFSSSFSFIRLHVFSMLAIYFLLNVASSYLSRFELLFKNNDIIFGANYADLTVSLKAITALPFVWFTIAILAIMFILRPNLKLILIGFILIIVPQLLFLKLFPAFVQSYIVSPNEFNKERSNIERNINYTQLAYNLKNIKEVDVNYKKTIQDFNSEAFNMTLNNVRLWNPAPLKSTLKQLQEIRLYYEFKHVDIDRYIIDNNPRQVMLSARELDITQISQKAQTWVNKHLIFTHGYGLCLTPVNRFTSEGLPELLIKDIPPISQTNIKISRPEIYFGEITNHYVITNSKQKEFDYPKDNENKYTHYNGKGGIPMDSFFKRLIYAIKLKDIKILISQNIHSKSRLIYDRNIHIIPRKLAPFITFDRDPYIVINDQGRLIWMLDGYTSSRFFPYATPYSQRTNYIRNSVLVTIDAYSGQTTMYLKDKNDPIATAYERIFPSLFKPLSELPDGLISHIRYPKDLFKITSKIYNTYHMNDAQVFYNKEDVWAFPTETYDSDTGITVEPYYMYTQNPLTGSFDYSIMMPLTPLNKNNLVAMLTASSEPSSFGELTTYIFPKQETIYGPLQIESRIDQNTEISKDLTLWGQVGSRVIRGNLMVIPFDNSLLYVEPIYLQATQSKLPELKRVIVSLGDQVVMTPTIYDGIRRISGEAYSVKKSPSDSATSLDDNSLNQLTKKIISTYSKVKASLKKADWASFGQQFKVLDQLIGRLPKEK